MAKSIRAIDSHGLHPARDKIAKALRKKHPQATPANEGLTDFDDRIPYKPPSPIEKVTSEVVTKAIRKFPTASSGGGSRLTSGHLKQMAVCPDATLEHGFIDSLAHLCTTLIRGEVPDDVVPYFMGAPLTPLRKPDGGVRPTAVGETLRRTVSLIAMSRVKAQAKDLL